jgi:hypothetical protein
MSNEEIMHAFLRLLKGLNKEVATPFPREK